MLRMWVGAGDMRSIGHRWETAAPLSAVANGGTHSRSTKPRVGARWTQRKLKGEGNNHHVEEDS